MKLANQQKRSTFISGCLHLLLFIVPLGYFALIATVVIHEVVGHGFVALALGGGFDRVTLKWDGMGLAEAYAPLHAPIRDDILVYLGGVASTTIAGILLLLAGLAVRRRLHLRLALLLLAIANLLEGPVYMFWNAYQPTPPGDIGVILAMIGPARVAIVRSVLMLVGGSLSVATTVVLPALLFRTVEEILGNGELLRGWQRAIALALLISLPGSLAGCSSTGTSSLRVSGGSRTILAPGACCSSPSRCTGALSTLGDLPPLRSRSGLI